MASTVKSQELAAWWRTGRAAPKTLLLSTPTSWADLFNATACDVLVTTGLGKSLWWTSVYRNCTVFPDSRRKIVFAVLLEGIPPKKGSD